MSASKSRLAYVDCFELLERALEAKQGIRVKLDASSSWYLRMRLHQARKIDRIDNAETYDEGHMLYGRSVYDKVMVRRFKEGEDWFVELLKVEGIIYEVEEIGEAVE